MGNRNNYIPNILYFAGIVVTFYLVFYACLAVMVALCLGGLFLTLDDKRPTYILQESLIGTVYYRTVDNANFRCAIYQNSLI